ncbi:nitrite reductase (NO-forming) [Propionibacterium cyclohexanicum]|uniref:Nitrite reductase (NO-forming) n=1 Tax=Propionibacterium cyclohexanicum TaxID=64702 RepID=A0A1H9RI92_9ACTN|nr:hypothetical protein [Propionibacterium cyclohexanicum]SER72531.1 nitrite reductase (NO-forming) [Propionibacterium cyclohexanicum]
MSRVVSRVRADRFATAWMIIALVVLAIGLLTRGVLPVPLWTMVHVVTLGVLANAILQWSWYFARTLLHLSADDRRAGLNNVIRAVTFNVLLVVLFAAMWTGAAWAAASCAGAVAAVICWHGLDMVLAARHTLATRFVIVIRYYAAASGFLVLGSIIAGFVAVALVSRHPAGWLVRWQDPLTVAHATANVAGWVGLTMAGTLITLGPTMMRTRMDPTAVSRATRGLGWMCAGLLVAVVAAGFDIMAGVGLGLLVFTVTLGVDVLIPLVNAARARAPRSVATWTLAAGVAWTLACLGAVIWHALCAGNATALRAANLGWLPLLGAAGLAQIFIAALTYLMPVVIGGGPAALRVGMGVLETSWPVRFSVRNTALLLIAVADDGATLHVLWWLLVLACYGTDIVLFALAGVHQATAKAAALRSRRIDHD